MVRSTLLHLRLLAGQGPEASHLSLRLPAASDTPAHLDDAHDFTIPVHSGRGVAQQVHELGSGAAHGGERADASVLDIGNTLTNKALSSPFVNGPKQR